MPINVTMRPDFPGPIPKEALAFFVAKGLVPKFSYLEVWKQEHTLAFTVAKVMEIDILGDVKKSLDAALIDGVPFDSWAKDILPTLKKSGWYADAKGNVPRRLRTIFDTNMRMSRAAGQWDRIERTKATQPILEYKLGPSEKHRPLHVTWAGTRLPVDDPWWHTHSPPLGYGCRCSLLQLSERVADRRGGMTPAPAVKLEPWKNPLTGMTEMVPEGVDPGFAYHKGQAGRERAMQTLLDNRENE